MNGELIVESEGCERFQNRFEFQNAVAHGDLSFRV